MFPACLCRGGVVGRCVSAMMLPHFQAASLAVDVVEYLDRRDVLRQIQYEDQC